ncbi:MAG: hypothetical protein ACRD09_10645 [Vicinamibacterales bacterium]
MKTSVRARRLAAAAALAAAIAAGSCGPRVDVKQALQVTDVTTGWFDAGIVDGKNKLVPSIAFRLKNAAAREVGSVQLNVVFVLAPDSRELDDTYMRGVGSDGLAPGAASDRFVVRAKYGFTGEQPRAEMLQHSKFVDARVRIQVKHASNQWVQLAEFPVERQLLIN